MGDTRSEDMQPRNDGPRILVTMINATHLLAASLVVLGLAACSSSTSGTGTGNGAGNGTGTGNPLLGGGNGTSGGTAAGGGLGGLQGTGGGTATCDDACAHYLQCKGDGWDTPQNRSTCDQNCAGLGVTAEQLTSFVGLDCASAIAVIEPTPAPAPGGTSGGASDCNGCTWDGSSCIYLTGSGGNYFACANACCGH
jgi:hypothetical protein